MSTAMAQPIPGRDCETSTAARYDHPPARKGDVAVSVTVKDPGVLEAFTPAR